MKKFFLIVFILADLALIAVSVLFLVFRLGSKKNPFVPRLIPSGSGAAPTVAGAPPAAGSAVSAPAPAATDVSLKPDASGARKILFTYRNSRPKKVMIRADFTGWRAEPMEKDAATPVWKYMAVLEPGEYSYLFSVDDKPVRDPANKRTKKVGTTIVSSLVVGPLSASSQ